MSSDLRKRKELPGTPGQTCYTYEASVAGKPEEASRELGSKRGVVLPVGLALGICWIHDCGRFEKTTEDSQGVAGRRGMFMAG